TVEHEQQAHLRDLRHGRNDPPLATNVKQRRRRGQVIIPDVVMDQLLVPFLFAGTHIQSHERVPIEAVPNPVRPIEVVSWRAQPRISPYGPALGGPSPLLQPVMTASPNTAGGDWTSYGPSSRSPSTPFFKSTRPWLPNSGAGFPVTTSTANRKCPFPAKTRGCRPGDPGQYASPRRAMGAASYFQSSSPVSGTSAYTPSGAVTYITPFTTIGIASEPGWPARNVQASVR